MEAKELGEKIAEGILFRLGTVALFLIITLTVGSYFAPKDDTDPKDGRSGLTVYTDNLTGVQYVGAERGLAVRVDTNGNPVVLLGGK